ncbi:MAG: DUF3179 domain-containing protein [Actinomycetota bacterium]
MKRAGLAVAALALIAAACSEKQPAASGVGTEAEAKFFWDEPGVDHPSLIPLDEIVSGGPPPDGIPPIDEPKFISPAEAIWLDRQEPVMVVEIGEDARAYPLQILLWHEIVNDTVGGRPVLVTYCPLCNSAIVFDRTVRGNVTTFGTSGRLYNSDLVMYDRATKSLWPQILGKAVVGPMIRTELEVIPSATTAFSDFRAAHPDGKVLSRDTGFDRDYGTTPYERYDSTADPFLFRGEVDTKLPAIARVVGVRTADGPKSYSVEALRRLGAAAAVNDRVGATELVVFFKRGTRSTLDGSLVAKSKDVGSSGVFSRRLGSRVFTFEADGDRFTDSETGSEWNIFGRAVAGPLLGRQLDMIDKVDTFWFAWAVFVPDAPLWTG